MTLDNEEYLQPSELCDFDRSVEIRDKALQLTLGCQNEEEMFQRIFVFVKELPYGLEDWDIAASETLAKSWGMCSGKSNLLVALLRSRAIPARYRVFHIRAEMKLWAWMAGDEGLTQVLDAVPPEQDHVDCEVWLGGWRVCDPSRDTPLERGMRTLGIPLEREVIPDAQGHVHYLTLACFDDWARKRQASRRFRENRSDIFARVNEHLRKIRAIGRDEKKMNSMESPG